jgi:uncharacterized membrane protein YeaQ/YmgE (transglycosylase-associated protein family)
MSLSYWIYVLLIGLLAGWLAGQIMKRRSFGLVGNIIVGVLGSLLGSFLFSMLGLAAYGTIGFIITATVGAIVLLYLVGFVEKL